MDWVLERSAEVTYEVVYLASLGLVWRLLSSWASLGQQALVSRFAPGLKLSKGVAFLLVAQSLQIEISWRAV